MTRREPDCPPPEAPRYAAERRASPTPPGCFSSATVRGWDHAAIVDYGIPGVVLMENAGVGATRALLELCADASTAVEPPVHIFLGPGNNAGDGLVMARHLDNRRIPVRLYQVGDREIPADTDAGVQQTIVERMGLRLEPCTPRPQQSDVPSSGTLVDAMFGTGLSRPLTAAYAHWAAVLSASPLPVVALDLPSGLDADRGEALGVVVHAAHTLTFAARKSGLERGIGPRVSGTVTVIDIGIPRAIWQTPAEDV